jgi:hypothetical protein
VSNSHDPLDATVESQVSKSARPFDMLRAGSGEPPDFSSVNN